MTIGETYYFYHLGSIIEQPCSPWLSYTRWKWAEKRGASMKAIVYKEYGSPEVLQLTEVAKPTPKENEILINVAATTVNFGDLMARDFKKRHAGASLIRRSLFWLIGKVAFGLNKPKKGILAAEFAGEIESVGKDVKQFKTGDQVFGYIGQNMGAYAEYLCMPEGGCVAIKPANMTFEEATTVPYGTTVAVTLLRKVNVQPGQKVLIIGASGRIGSAAVQLSKYFGADVTGVCGTRRLDFVKSLGADTVIDYKKEDFTQNGETYDLIFDILGRSSFSKCKGSLNKKRPRSLASFKMKQVFQMMWIFHQRVTIK